MTGNCVAYPILISLANIDASVRSKTSLHGYLLLALLPIPKFIHKNSRVRGLLHDRLVHQALNRILAPLKTAATVGVMMSDPVGNLRLVFKSPVRSGFLAPKQRNRTRTGPMKVPRAGNRQLDR